MTNAYDRREGKLGLRATKILVKQHTEKKTHSSCQHIHSSLPTINLGNLGCKLLLFFNLHKNYGPKALKYCIPLDLPSNSRIICIRIKLQICQLYNL